MSLKQFSFSRTLDSFTKTRGSSSIRSILFLSITTLLTCLASAQDSVGTHAAAPGVNLAVVAKASASFTSGDTIVNALNDGFAPRSSRDNRHGSYGNWPHTGTEWVQY